MSNIIKQKTIGINPLEDYLSYAQLEVEKDDLNSKEELQQKEEHVKKQRITFHISENLINRVKNAVYWEPGLTLANFAEMALTKAIDELENERGKPFDQRRDYQLRGGRPIK